MLQPECSCKSEVDPPSTPISERKKLSWLYLKARQFLIEWGDRKVCLWRKVGLRMRTPPSSQKETVTWDGETKERHENKVCSCVVLWHPTPSQITASFGSWILTSWPVLSHLPPVSSVLYFIKSGQVRTIKKTTMKRNRSCFPSVTLLNKLLSFEGKLV